MAVRIVDGARQLTVAALGPSTAKGRVSNQSQTRLQTKIGKERLFCDLGRRAKCEVSLADLALVQEHFGANRSEALRLSLHLTAQAIRRNRALPELP